MITVKTELRQREYTINADGHAGYDENGKDIVCAAVSTAIYTLNAGLESKVFVKKIISENGHLEYSVCWETKDSDEVLSVINAVEKTLNWIIGQYPDNVRRQA